MAFWHKSPELTLAEAERMKAYAASKALEEMSTGVKVALTLNTPSPERLEAASKVADAIARAIYTRQNQGPLGSVNVPEGFIKFSGPSKEEKLDEHPQD